MIELNDRERDVVFHLESGPMDTLDIPSDSIRFFHSLKDKGYIFLTPTGWRLTMLGLQQLVKQKEERFWKTQERL